MMRAPRMMLAIHVVGTALAAPAAEMLTQLEFERVVAQAVQAAQAVLRAPQRVEVVVDRNGRALAVWSASGVAPTAVQIGVAVAEVGPWNF